MSNIKRHVFILGVTGGIACGKSEVGRILGETGFSVCDADRIAHDLMKKGLPVYTSVVERFGNSILREDGEISRPMLGRIVFNDSAAREDLNRLVHPAVRDYLKQWICEQRANERASAVLIPLLFESGMQDLDWDAVLCVSCSDEEVYRRLKARGLEREEAERRIASQMTLAEKEKKSGYIIRNCGSLNELEQAVRRSVKTIAGER